ncbi:DUF2867 domain-containing protein [Kiloniella antarctica]|uniref:DUF2867 domain-containing protein n=1 Tax=Kiloniella antarctica TaxID=1550907 RepID=A0ABW5BPC7_9PROT
MTQSGIVTYKKTNIHIVAPVEELDFFDTQFVSLSKEIRTIEAWRMIASNPPRMLKLAFLLRDKVSAFFGVQRINGFSGGCPDQVQVKDQLDFFVVEYISDTVLTLTVRDKHLDVMTCITTDHERLTITSSVKTHNAFGRVYMIPVAPAHRLIVSKDLKRVKQEIGKFL